MSINTPPFGVGLTREVSNSAQNYFVNIIQKGGSNNLIYYLTDLLEPPFSSLLHKM